jgi:hypothetical protein
VLPKEKPPEGAGAAAAVDPNEKPCDMVLLLLLLLLSWTIDAVEIAPRLSAGIAKCEGMMLTLGGEDNEDQGWEKRCDYEHHLRTVYP